MNMSTNPTVKPLYISTLDTFYLKDISNDLKEIVQSQYFTKIQMASSVHSAITNTLYEQVRNPNKLIFFSFAT